MATNVFLILKSPWMEQTKSSRNAALADVPNQKYGTTAYNRPGAIEVLSFGFSVEQVGSEEAGRPRSVEKVNHSDVKIVKAVDSRSPLLFGMCCEGTFISAAEIQCFGPDPTRPYLVYRMQYVHIASYSPSGGSGVPTEEIGLRFGEMGVQWDDSGLGGTQHGNSKQGRIARNWSWVSEWPITLGDPGSWAGMNGQEHANVAAASDRSPA